MASPTGRKTPEQLVAAYLQAVRRSKGSHPYASLLGLTDFDAESLQIKLIRGLRFTSFLHLTETMKITWEAAADILMISSRSLQRRKVEGRLHADESDRLLRLSRVFGRAIQLFEGDKDAAASWMNTPLATLGNASPLEMSKTGPGTLEVEKLIGRLEHGVFA